MAIAVVQSAVILNPASAAGSFTSPTTAGNCVVVLLFTYAGTNVTITTSAVTLGGSAGNFAQAAAVQSGFASSDTQYIGCWIDPDCVRGQTAIAATVANATWGAYSGSGLILLELSGVAASSPVDASSAGSATAGTAISSGTSGATTAAGEMAIGAAYPDNGLTGEDSSYTSILLGGSPEVASAGYLTLPSSGATTSYTATQSATGCWAALVITLLPASTTLTASASQAVAPVQAAAASKVGGATGAVQTVAPAQSATASAGALAVTTASLPGATIGTAYSQTLEAAGGTPPYTWSISAGSLPSWAALDASTGVISGQPAGGETGTTDFTVEVTDSGGTSAPSGPSGSWALAWNDEFNNAAGMSGSSNGLDLSKWNCGWYYGPSAPGGTGYDGTSYTASSGGGAVEFYGPGALAFPSGGGMEMSCYASGDGPDGASYSSGGHTSTTESGGVNTAGIMNIMPDTSYSVPSDIAGTVIQAANIVIEVECQFAGPDDPAGAGAANGYWQYIGLYNCGDCSTPDYPNSGTWTEEMDIWEEVGGQGSTGADFFLTFHAASAYGSVVSMPSSVASTDMSLAMHKYTVQFTGTTVTLWVDGVEVTGISPTTAEVSAQWATPMYFNMQFQVFAGMTPTGGTEDGETATPWKVNYVRVFTQ